MKRAKPEPISNLAVALLLSFAVLIVCGLGLLWRASGSRNVVAGIASPAAASVNAGSKIDEKGNSPTGATGPIGADGQALLTLRIIARASTEEIPAAAPLNAPSAEPTREVVSSATENPPAAPAQLKVPLEAPSVTASTPASSNELIGEITGMSYTTKKLMANGLDPNNAAGASAPKKGDAKKAAAAAKVPKPTTPVAPLVKATIAKPEAPKATVPALPALPSVADGKVDFSHSPVYVLNDGRRLRAVLMRENNGVIAIRNEAGAEITFKKSDVKEVLRN